jgi:hypothetical protein
MRSDVLADDVLSGYGCVQAGLPSRSSRQPVRLRPFGSGATALLASRAKAGGARRDRTDDLMLAKHALSQLSYGPVLLETIGARRRPFGLCRARFTLSSRVAAPRAAEGEAWWAWEDLNFRPHAYQARALTN